MSIIDAQNETSSVEIDADSSTVIDRNSKPRRFFGVLSIVEFVALVVLAIGALILFSLLIQVMSAGPVILTPGTAFIVTPTPI